MLCWQLLHFSLLQDVRNLMQFIGWRKRLKKINVKLLELDSNRSCVHFIKPFFVLLATVPFESYFWFFCQVFICTICQYVFFFAVVLFFPVSIVFFSQFLILFCHWAHFCCLKDEDFWYWISGIKLGLILLLFNWSLFWAVISAILCMRLEDLVM